MKNFRSVIAALLGLNSEASDDDLKKAIDSALEPDGDEKKDEAKSEDDEKKDDEKKEEAKSEDTAEEKKDDEKKEPESKLQSKANLADRIRAFRTAQPGSAAQVAELKSQIASLTTQLTHVSQDSAASRSIIKSIAHERDALKSQLTEVEKALDEKANTIKSQAVAIAESVGISIDKLPAPVAPEKVGDKTMTRSQFSALSPSAQMQFCLKGGQVTAD